MNVLVATQLQDIDMICTALEDLTMGDYVIEPSKGFVIRAKNSDLPCVLWVVLDSAKGGDEVKVSNGSTIFEVSI